MEEYRALLIRCNCALRKTKRESRKHTYLWRTIGSSWMFQNSKNSSNRKTLQNKDSKHLIWSNPEKVEAEEQVLKHLLEVHRAPRSSRAGQVRSISVTVHITLMMYLFGNLQFGRLSLIICKVLLIICRATPIYCCKHTRTLQRIFQFFSNLYSLLFFLVTFLLYNYYIWYFCSYNYCQNNFCLISF